MQAAGCEISAIARERTCVAVAKLLDQPVANVVFSPPAVVPLAPAGDAPCLTLQLRQQQPPQPQLDHLAPTETFQAHLYA